MKLVATILAGPDLSSFPRAFASIVDHVDLVILIDTVDTQSSTHVGDAFRDETLLSLATPRTIICAWPWQGRFDAARNEALALAAESGANWSITLDSDEYYDDASQLRALCASAGPTVEAIHLRCGEASRYYQPRIIRLPCQRRWVGRTHEAIDFGGVGPRFDSPRFFSDPKTPEQVRAKSERDLPLLLAEIAEKPDDARWYYYLGNTYSNLGEGLDGSHELWGKAIDAYLLSGERSLDREYKALSFYRAANIMIRKRLEYSTAIEILMHGMANHAGIPELPLLAGWACLRLAPLQTTQTSAKACLEQALYFAGIAETHGEGGRHGAIEGRNQHVDPEAATIGPTRLMAEVYRAAGLVELEAAARKIVEEWND